MANFHLEIVTLDGLKYEGEVERLTLRTITGDLAILARHTNYCTAVGMGTAKLRFPDGKEREAACVGGMLSVMDGVCRLLPTTFEWSDEIDLLRAAQGETLGRGENSGACKIVSSTDSYPDGGTAEA